MLDIQFIRDNPDRVREAIRNKGAGTPDIVDRLLDLDTEWRTVTTRLQQARAEANEAARSIGELMKAGRKDDAQRAIETSSRLKSSIREDEERIEELERSLDALQYDVPNVPHESVPVGTSADDNVVTFESSSLPEFDFEPVGHWDICDRHGLVEFNRGAKVTGAGFPFYIGKGARLQRALVAFFLDLAVEEGGYTEMQAPLVVNEDSARGTGQLPDKEDLMYEAPRDGLYLIPTAEVPVTNYHRDEIIDEADLPLRYCAYTPCFRREAGSYGRDVRGLNRLHQFDKVELVHFVRPEDSYGALETLRQDAERVLERLGIPYRRLLMCTGDMGFTQAKKYDLEVWSAGQKRWLEVSSVSNFEAFQARRMRIRYRPSDGGKPQILHTLNGSGLALPRIVAALLENNQQADGSVLVPDALRPYTAFDRIG